jgi:dTDP-4-amino-4,6-dideoxygalactose transaminase
MKVPFVDLKIQYQSIRDEVRGEIDRMLESAQFILGPNVVEFEKEFAAYCGTKYAAGVASGTDALLLALEALHIGPGDEVITVVNTFIATAASIMGTGAVPVFVDMDSQTYNLDSNQIEAKVHKKTRAIIPVHLYGQPADMSPILEIARRKKLFVIEDAAQAHGATYQGKKTGSIGNVGCFSFYPSKNLGAYGDAGAVTTDDADIYARVKLLRDHGREGKYSHSVCGHNSRLDEIQAAVLRIKLRRLDAWNKRRQEIAGLYSRLLKDLPLVTAPGKTAQANHVYHVYVIRCRQRDELQQWLTSKEISTGIHYPMPLHLQKAFASLGHVKGDFPIAEKAAGEIISLPMYPEMGDDAVEYVCRQISNFYKDR